MRFWIKDTLTPLFHPFNGFWDLKFEKKGNMLTATCLLILLIFLNILKKQFTGFIYNYNNPARMNVITEIAMVVIPFLMWCISNFGVTTLMDGKGKFKDIYITTAYALIPLILLGAIMLPISRMTILQEESLYTMFESISVLWTVFLVFVGTMVIHDYTGLKNLFSIILTIVGMLAVTFLAMLLFSLFEQIYNFFYLVYRELALR